ncbi:MAG: 50S ribosomal protein L11 [Legionellales bacterium]|nr:50S ribosomal protein L11 [Legionellales bacterium]|tara:strand:+ start:2154 stop:2600 length:447 start_codon:yes stop_codon:yes gene_type:complete
MAEKKAVSTINLQVKAGEANPSPPIGPALGQHGLNIMDFCKQFNDRSSKIHSKGTVLPVIITVYADRSFSFVIKTPPASFLLKLEAGIKSGSGVAKDIVATINQDQLKKIAEMKMPDLNAVTIEGAMKIIAGTARSMGIAIEGQEEAK